MIYLSLILITALGFLGITLWNVMFWPRIEATGNSSQKGRISILIPARDEELNIDTCLNSSLMQGAIVREILVYDDHSTDDTALIVGEFIKSYPSVRIVQAVKLPDGWCGKNFACSQLASAASSEWILFLDADARLERGAAAKLLEEAEVRKVTLLSCWPALELRSFWEKALMPMLNFVVFTLYPAPLSFQRNDISLGLAHGACLLVHRATYLSVGGHGAVRDAINEDIRLAQKWREMKERGLCFDGQGIVSVRMYRSFTEIWRGFQKNFFPAFRSVMSFWAFILLHITVFLMPFLLLPVSLMSFKLWPLLIAAACVLLIRLLLAVRFDYSLWSILLHPLSESILIALGISSWWRLRSGRGVEWKGRRYRENSQ